MSIFYDIIEYLQPAYVIMEQVLDTWKKEGGLYTRYASGGQLAFIALGVAASPVGHQLCVWASAWPSTCL